MSRQPFDISPKAKAAKHHRMARHGENPVRARAEIPTVAEAVEEFFKEFGPTWVGRSTEHAYRVSLAKYVLPVLGDQRVDLVRRSDLAAVVRPAWLEYRRVGRDLLRVLRGAFRWVRAHDFRSDLLSGPGLRTPCSCQQAAASER